MLLAKPFESLWKWVSVTFLLFFFKFKHSCVYHTMFSLFSFPELFLIRWRNFWIFWPCFFILLLHTYVFIYFCCILVRFLQFNFSLLIIVLPSAFCFVQHLLNFFNNIIFNICGLWLIISHKYSCVYECVCVYAIFFHISLRKLVEVNLPFLSTSSINYASLGDKFSICWGYWLSSSWVLPNVWQFLSENTFLY